MSDQGSLISVQTLLHSLALPADSRVNQRVPKTLLLEHGAPTTADKRLINEGIEEIQWLAAIKPNISGVAEYRNDQREYLELAILSITLRGLADRANKALRLAELLHRAVPYPLLLLVQNGDQLLLTLAHKRWSQSEAGKVVIDGELVVATLPPHGLVASSVAGFYHSLALNRQPQSHLRALYQGWIDKVHALEAAMKTGAFRPATNPEQAAARRQALQSCELLEAEVGQLRSQASKEKQVSRQVELNLALKRVRAELSKQREAL